MDRAGELLKEKSLSDSELQKALDVLSNWRAYHAEPLSTFGKVLRRRSGKICQDSNPVAAQRLKRTPSILLKLKKYKTMRLSLMQDIGGLRVIFDDMKCVNELVEMYRQTKSRHVLSSLDDYVVKPKNDGYRSMHLIYKLGMEPGLFIEIQVRSYLQHIWATAVEVFGTLKKSSFKTGYGEKRWLKFFKLLSSVFALKEKNPLVDEHSNLSHKVILDELKDEMRNLQAIEKLSIYTNIYKIVSKEMSTVGRKGNYFLFLLNSKDATITIKRFGANRIENALESYRQEEEKFYNNASVNIVLVRSSDIRNLEVSYPNYFMNTKMLIRHLSEIMMDQFL